MNFSAHKLIPVAALGMSAVLMPSVPALAAQAPAKTKAHALMIDLDHGSGAVEFHAVGHPSALKIVGKGTSPHGDFTVDQRGMLGQATFDLSTLDTGIKMRDEHMKNKYLEVQKYPQAKLTLTHLALPKTAESGTFSADGIPFEGKLLLHGVEKPVTGTMNVSGDGHNAKIDAQFSVKLADYGIAIPSFAGITMADDVNVAVDTTGPLAAAH